MSKRKHEDVLIDDLKAADQDEDVHDVDLVGSDGVRVPAARALLAFRSDYWKKKWFRREEGAFAAPPTDNEVSHFPSSTLRAVKKYCYTGACEGFEEASSVDRAREMTRLILAAEFYLLPRLAKAIRSKVNNLMEWRPPLACEVLEESTFCGHPDSRAKKLIALHVEASLLPKNETGGKGVTALTGPSLESIITFAQGRTLDNAALFRATLKWYEENKEDRLDAAKKIVSEMRLDLISPSDIHRFVKDSELVSDGQCLDALEEWSLRAETIMPLAFLTKQQSLSLESEHVLVEGAGVEEMNGLYLPVGARLGVTRYVKRGLWMGSDIVCELFRYSGSAGRRWIIAGYVPSADEPKKFFLYSSECSEDENEIPKDNWTLTRKAGSEEERFVAQAPAPTVTHVKREVAGWV